MSDGERYNVADFPPTKGWQKRVALANRSILHAYKRTRGELNFGEVNAIFKADDACRAYLRGRAGAAERD